MTTQMMKLGDVCHTFTGGTPSRTKPEYFGGGIPWVKITDLLQGVVIATGESVSSAGIANSSAKLLPVGTVLISIFATIGRTAVLGIEAATNQAIAGVVPHDTAQLDPQYLRYYLDSQHGYLNREARGVAQPNINQGILKNLDIPIPPLPEQRRIVDLLSRAEGIVRLRREAEKKAAELIPALFNDMFGDPGTNPKGWLVALLPNVLSRAFKNGLYLPKESYSTDGIEMVHMSDAFYGEVKRGGLRRVLANKKQIDDYGLTKTDLLVARRSLTFDGAAKLCGIPESGDPLLFESSFIRLTPDLTKVRTEFLLYYLNNASTRQAHVLSRVSGITISGINQAAMNQIPVLMPPLPLQDSFAARVAEVRSIQSQQSTATAKAQATFDALLARCFAPPAAVDVAGAD